MTFEQFHDSLESSAMPTDMSLALQALWMDARDDWDAAHDLANRNDANGGAWVHAYLHRKEGDAANAGYWYRRAHKPACTVSLEQEWEMIARALIEG